MEKITAGDTIVITNCSGGNEKWLGYEAKVIEAYPHDYVYLQPIGIRPDGAESSQPFYWQYDRVRKVAAVVKPPLGITPQFLWDEQRMTDLIDALERYMDAGIDCPREWMVELLDVTRRVIKHKGREE